MRREVAVRAVIMVLRGRSCRQPIDASNFLINEVPPRELPRMVSLLSGRMPDQSDPGEALASFTLAQVNGVRVGSVIRVPLVSASPLNGGAAGQRTALRVVGIVAAETEFPSGAEPHYDPYSTAAFAATVNHRAAPLTWSPPSPPCWPRDHIRAGCSGQSEQLPCSRRSFESMSSDKGVPAGRNA